MARLPFLILLAAAALAAPASAPAQPAPCAAMPAEPWRAARAIPSAVTADATSTAPFAVGEAVLLRLHPDGDVAYVTLPKGAGEEKSFGGLASFTVERGGTYRVGLSKASWVDVVEGGKAAEAGRFGPGPACSGIRKAVEFALKPGRHVLEISGNEDAEIGVWVAPME